MDLQANNYAYSDQKITRPEWVARNRELAAEAQELGLGITLSPNAVTDLDRDLEA